MAYIRRVDEEIPLDSLVEHMQDMDIILTEGFKRENKPQIEVYYRPSGEEPLGTRGNLLAVVSDVRLYEHVSCFD
jgi:molybdopterin-guanine dinucleotide biosynthesis protein B